jgi:hypothetical protein
MEAQSENQQASIGQSRGRHERHRPEETLLYRIVAKHFPDLLTQLAAEGRTLSRYVAVSTSRRTAPLVVGAIERHLPT